MHFLLALIGALLINLLIMVLIPWLFRGGGNQRQLPNLIKAPILISPVKPETDLSRPTSEPESQPETKLPEPPPDLISPPLSLPEINPEPALTEIQLDTRIDSQLHLKPPSQVLPPATPVSTRDFYRMGELDQEPVNQVRMEPVYPFRARRRGIEGSVKIRFFVTSSGKVSDLEIIKARPEGFFEKAVRQTVSRWRFQPGRVGGVKVKTLVETTIVFKLSR